MHTYAIEEVQSLLHQIDANAGLNLDQKMDKLNYVCAIFSELAYHHVPQAEIDSKKRAKFISSKAYRQILKRKMANSIDITPYISQQQGEGELPQSFIVTTEQVVAICHILDKRLFIAYRGTKFTLANDWCTNIQAKKTTIDDDKLELNNRFFQNKPRLYHKGFLDEARRICELINYKLISCNLCDIQEVYLSGHSLGGAVAVLSQHFLQLKVTRIFIYGAPRSSNLNGGLYRKFRYPIQIRHAGDVVPTVPPLSFRYVDYPLQMNTNGNVYCEPRMFDVPFISIFRWAWFLIGFGRSHSMEIYRKELGRTAQALGAELELVPMKRLTNAQMK